MRRTFSSLKYRNYRLFFAGQAVSQVGSWMQRFALGWFMLQLTDDPVAVGLLALATFLPFMLFGLFAGVITDRLDARKLVIVHAGVAARHGEPAGVDRLRRLCPGRGCSMRSRSPAGLVLVLDVPSRQQLTYRMVGREALPNAIALNSSVFNASRILGPAAAGIVYGIGGAGVCFLVNAISFLAVLLGLFAMRTRDFFQLEEFERPSILRGTLEGLAYVRRQPRMLILLGLTVVLSTFCFNFNVTLPLLADHTLHASAVVYGLLSAVFGAGALVGALTAAALGRASTKVMLLGSLVFTASELALAPVHGAILAGVLLFFVGAGFAAWSANSNTSMQLAAPDRLRGRIIGIYFYAFNGTGPIGGVLTGWLIAKGGTELAFLIGGVLGLAATAVAARQLRGRPPLLALRRLRLPVRRTA